MPRSRRAPLENPLTPLICVRLNTLPQPAAPIKPTGGTRPLLSRCLSSWAGPFSATRRPGQNMALRDCSGPCVGRPRATTPRPRCPPRPATPRRFYRPRQHCTGHGGAPPARPAPPADRARGGGLPTHARRRPVPRAGLETASLAAEWRLGHVTWRGAGAWAVAAAPESVSAAVGRGGGAA